jgi:acetylornithine/succinyldiaminopimelate/putrescine aminotransferase
LFIGVTGHWWLMTGDWQLVDALASVRYRCAYLSRRIVQMQSDRTNFKPVCASLKELAGADYLEAVCRARAAVSGENLGALRQLAEDEVDFFPKAFQARLLDLLPQTGQSVCPPLATSSAGATTGPFAAATQVTRAPLTGFGYYRVGEDGRLYLISKSEHYHVPLGHSFPGYRLLDHARRLGLPNATHNNTRGHITRLLEEELIRTANGIPAGDTDGVRRLVASTEPHVLNRVLNLQTGSLAAEAALKMILARFYRSGADSPLPPYAGRTPVIVVVGDEDGELEGNYHGTTVLAQMLRGLWPELLSKLEQQGLLLVRAVRPNSFEDVQTVFDRYDSGEHKVAGFFHEIVMMNYGARLLTKEFLAQVYALCHQRDVPTVVDEIQSCAWYPEVYQFREYGLQPDFVAVGKGLPGGEYAASKILFNAAYDNLPQFGALVTNGQEELASLAYLVTMKWVEANADVTRAVGDYYERRLRALAARHADVIEAVDGMRHLCALRFRELAAARSFASTLNARGLDLSVQTYKPSCPPAALTKLPLVAGYEAVDLVVGRMEEALCARPAAGNAPPMSCKDAMTMAQRGTPRHPSQQPHSASADPTAASSPGSRYCPPRVPPVRVTPEPCASPPRPYGVPPVPPDASSALP